MGLAAVHRVFVHDHANDGGIAGNGVHNRDQDIFHHAAQAAGAAFALDGFAGNGAQGTFGEVQLHIVHFQQCFVLLDDAVFGLFHHTDQCILVQRIQHGDHRDAADQFRNQAKLYQIVRLYLTQQLLAGFLVGLLQLAAKAQRRIIGAALDHFFQAVKRTAADEQNVLGVDLDKLLLRVLAAALRRHIADGAFQNFQQRLLHALAAHIAGDGRVFALARDLIDLIDVNNADLCLGNIKIRRLDQLEQNVLHILAHISGLGKGGGIRNGKGHTQHFCQRLCQQSFAGARGAQQQHIAFLQLDFGALTAQNALIVVVHRNRQHLFGFFLPHHILIQAFLDLLGRKHIDLGHIAAGLGSSTAAGARLGRRRNLALIGQHIVAHFNAVLANVHTGANDDLLYFLLAAPAKAADDFLFVVIFFCHSDSPFIDARSRHRSGRILQPAVRSRNYRVRYPASPFPAAGRCIG